MRTSNARHLLAMAVLLAAAPAAVAGPDLPITAPPVLPNGAGPPFDPNAASGQWFQNLNAAGAPTFESRPYEFYDNLRGQGGGAASTDAIRGVLSSFNTDANGNIASFTIAASITNDLATISGPWAPGTNDHGEALAVASSYVGTLFATKMTIEWADDGIPGNFNSTVPPNRGPESNFFAIGYDQLAWFSFTGTGAFQVPTYDFGDIALGQTVTRFLQFGLYTPETAAAFFTSIYGTPTPTAGDLARDLFLNRTTDLKIGNYFDSLTVDSGGAYPGPPPLLSGNVSVFNAVPEPGSLTLLGLGVCGLGGYCWKRRPKRAEA